MPTDINVILIGLALLLSLGAIYILYSIIMYNGSKKEAELQLTTKNVLDQVEILFEKKEYAIVELLASSYLERIPSHTEVRRYLAKAYYHSKKYNNSLKQCHILLRKSPNDTEIRKILGNCYIAKGLYGKALKEFEDLFNCDNNDIEVLTCLSKLYLDTEQFYSAKAIYDIMAGLISDNTKLAEIYMTLANLNENLKNYPDAFEAYKNRLELLPTDIETNRKLVELYLKLENYTKALETLNYMLTFVTEPKSLAWIYETLVGLYVKTDEYEKAIEYSERLLETQYSDKFKIRQDIASFYMHMNNYEQGISILEDLVMLSQTSFEVTTFLANSYIECSQYDKALDLYLKLLDKSTQQEAKEVRSLICNLYINWAKSKTELNDYLESYHYLSLAEQYNPKNPEIYYNIALNNLQQKNYSVTISSANQAITLTDDDSKKIKYYLLLAEAHHNLSNFFEEKKALSDLLKIDEHNPLGLYYTGVMYITMHDVNKAETCFLSALESDPNLLDARLSLASLYEINNKEKAKMMYLDILEENPTCDTARNALAELQISDY